MQSTLHDFGEGCGFSGHQLDFRCSLFGSGTPKPAPFIRCGGWRVRHPAS